MPEPKKKRNCTICGAEHEVGQPCTECGWHQEKEDALAKADIERKRLREEASKPQKKGGGFFG